MNYSPSVNPYEAGEVSKQKFPAGPVQFPGQQIELAFLYDIDYLLEAYNRYRLRKDSSVGKPLGFIGRWWLSIFCIGYSLFLIATRGPDDLVSPAFFLTLGGLLAFKSKLQNIILRRWFRSVPNLNQQFSITLSDECFHTQSSLHDMKLMWSAFSDAIELPSGVFLLEGKHRYHWLPFSALADQNQSSILYRYISSRLSPAVELASNSFENEANVSGDQIKATIIYDSQYVLATLARQHRHGSSWLRTIFRYVIAAILLGVAVMTASSKLYWLVIPSLTFAVLIAFRRQINNFRYALMVKSSPHRNERLVMIASDRGIHVRSPLQNADLDWGSFSEAVEFSDGVLLCRGKIHANWLPLKCLENVSDASRLYEFVSSRISSAKAAKVAQALQQSKALS